MTSMFLLFLQLATVFTFGCYVFSSAIHIELVPQAINELTTDQLNITCVPGGADHWSKTVVSLQIGKKGQQPMAAYLQQKVTDGPDMKSNVKADGHIDSDPSKSYIRLTITKPNAQDAGTYSCVVFYMDQSFLMKEESAETNLIVDDKVLKEEVTKLMERISVLETAVREQKDINTAQEVQLQNQQNLISNHWNQAKYTIAFSASYTTKFPVTQGQTLVFSHALLNHGDSYNTTTGIFTAPRKGLYVFHLVVMTDWAEWRVDVDLRVKGRAVASLYSHDNTHWDQSSLSSVVSLDAGDDVKPVVTFIQPSGRVHVGHHSSAFTGYLLKLT